DRQIAYLRLAQAYMLISMLTGISVSLGLFQAMLVLLRYGGIAVSFMLEERLAGVQSMGAIGAGLWLESGLGTGVEEGRRRQRSRQDGGAGGGFQRVEEGAVGLGALVLRGEQRHDAARGGVDLVEVDAREGFGAVQHGERGNEADAGPGADEFGGNL